MTDDEKVELILEWADEKDRGFDTEFVEEMKEIIDAGEELTFGQSVALDNIISRWNIEQGPAL